MKRKKKTHTLAQRRWLNRVLIWPQRKVNRLIIKHDAIMYIALTKLRQFGTSPKVWALATRMYRQLKFTGKTPSNNKLNEFHELWKILKS